MLWLYHQSYSNCLDILKLTNVNVEQREIADENNRLKNRNFDVVAKAH